MHFNDVLGFLYAYGILYIIYIVLNYLLCIVKWENWRSPQSPYMKYNTDPTCVIQICNCLLNYASFFGVLYGMPIAELVSTLVLQNHFKYFDGTNTLTSIQIHKKKRPPFWKINLECHMVTELQEVQVLIIVSNTI